MTYSLPRLAYSAVAAVGVLTGAAIVLVPQAAPLFALLMLAGLGLMAPTASWVATAVVLAVGGGTLTLIGAPETVAQVSIIVAWAALGLALVRYRGDSRVGRRLLLGLALLITAALMSALVSGAEPLRPLFYLSLLATPFALVASLVLDPPSPQGRRVLVFTLVALILVQIPFVLWQTAVYGISDSVRGTFIGSAVGAHMVGAVSLIGAVWLALQRPLTFWRIAAVVMLAAVPLLAAANQVVFALPMAVLAVAALSRRKLLIAGAIGWALALALVLLPSWNSIYARNSLERADDALKVQALEATTEAAADGPATLVFGQGPARTVSHAAFLSTEEAGLVQSLGLAPAQVPVSFFLRDMDAAVSAKRPESSVIGVFGDLGVLGLGAYVLLFVTVFDQCRRRFTPTAQATTVGIAMLAMLGYISDWLEQPPFTLVLALLAGLALTEASPPDRAGLPIGR